MTQARDTGNGASPLRDRDAAAGSVPRAMNTSVLLTFVAVPGTWVRTLAPRGADSLVGTRN